MTNIINFEESKTEQCIRKLHDNCVLQTKVLLSQYDMNLKSSSLVKEKCSDINDACFGGNLYKPKADNLYKIRIESEEIVEELRYYPFPESESLFVGIDIITSSNKAFLNFRLIYVPMKMRNRGFMTSILKEIKQFLNDMGLELIIHCGDASEHGETTHVAGKLGIELDEYLLRRLELVTDRYK